MTGRRARQRGFALLIVLWTLAVLALLGSTLLASARQDTQLSRNLLDAAELDAAAHGAVQQAIFWLLDNSDQHWPADDIPHAIAVGRALVVVRIQNETDKVNPNVASVALLSALLVRVGANPITAMSVAAAIDQWREGGGVPGRPSAAAMRYAAAGLDYAPSGAPFRNLDELGEVLGMTSELLARLLPHMTVFTDQDPDAATQDPVVAQALAAVGRSGNGARAADGGPLVVSVTAVARGPRNARLTVQEVVRANARPVGSRYDVLNYTRL